MRPSWDSDQCTTGRTPGGQVATAALSACSSVKLPGQNLENSALQYALLGFKQMQHQLQAQRPGFHLSSSYVNLIQCTSSHMATTAIERMLP